MSKGGLNIRKKIGLVLLGLVLLYWIAIPVIPFIDIPHKVIIIPALIVAGEIFFVVAVAILGREYWDSIKTWPRRLFSLERKRRSDLDKKEL